MKNVFSYKKKCLRVGSLGLTGGPLSAAGPGHDWRRAPSIASERVGPPVQPILKHEPRSLANVRVAGREHLCGRNENEGRLHCRGLIPWCGHGRTAGLSHWPPGGGARARSQGPERW